MSVTYQSVGAVGQGSASCAPACPVVVNAGELLVLPVAWGNSTDDPPATPDGWTAPPNSVFIGGAGSWGLDSGHRNISVFIKIADGTEDLSSVTVNNGGSGTDRVISGQIARLSKTAAAWFVKVVGASDSTSGTSFAIDAPTDPGAVSGDLALVGAVWVPDTAGVVGGTADIAWPGTGSGATQIQSIANSNGNDHRFLLFRRPLTGTSTGAPSFVATGGANVAGSGAIILIHDDAAPVVEPDDTTHTHTATGPTLTQHHVLSVDSATHAHEASSPTLTTTTTVEPHDATHGHSASSPTLTQHHIVEPADAGHAHSAASPTLTQHQVLDPDDATHGHAATSPTLTQHHALDPGDAAHAHTATSPTLTQHHALTPDSASHEHTATSPTLTTTTSVEPADALHTHSATSPTLTQHHALTPNSSSHTHTASSPTLVQHQVVDPDDTHHGHAATSPTLTTFVLVNPDDTIHTHAATSPTLTQRHVLTPDSAVHVHVATSPDLTQRHIIEPHSTVHAHTATSPLVVHLQPTTTPPSRTSYAQADPAAVAQGVPVDIAVALPVVDVSIASPPSTSTSSP